MVGMHPAKARVGHVANRQAALAREVGAFFAQLRRAAQIQPLAAQPGIAHDREMAVFRLRARLDHGHVFGKLADFVGLFLLVLRQSVQLLQGVDKRRSLRVADLRDGLLLRRFQLLPAVNKARREFGRQARYHHNAVTLALGSAEEVNAAFVGGSANFLNLRRFSMVRLTLSCRMPTSSAISRLLMVRGGAKMRFFFHALQHAWPGSASQTLIGAPRNNQKQKLAAQ